MPTGRRFMIDLSGWRWMRSIPHSTARRWRHRHPTPDGAAGHCPFHEPRVCRPETVQQLRSGQVGCLHEALPIGVRRQLGGVVNDRPVSRLDGDRLRSTEVRAPQIGTTEIEVGQRSSVPCRALQACMAQHGARSVGARQVHPLESSRGQDRTRKCCALEVRAIDVRRADVCACGMSRDESRGLLTIIRRVQSPRQDARGRNDHQEQRRPEGGRRRPLAPPPRCQRCRLIVHSPAIVPGGPREVRGCPLEDGYVLATSSTPIPAPVEWSCSWLL